MFARQLYSGEGIRLSKETMDMHNLSSTLAWAAQHKIPYERALKSLAAQDIPLLFRILAICISPLYHTSLTRKNNDGYSRWIISGVKPFYRRAVESAVTDLQAGFSLSAVLEKHLHWWLPEFYIHSIKLAEDNGSVEDTLIQLANTTKKVNRRRKEIFSVMLYPLLIMISGLIILWGLMVFIIPKFNKIFIDLLGDEPFPALTELVIICSDLIIPENPLSLIFILQMPWMLYYFCCTHRGDWILIKIPFLRRSVLRWKKIDAIQALAVYTRLKIPLPEALSMVCDHQPGSPVKKRLLKVREDVMNGRPLKESWSEHFKKDHLSKFYVHAGTKVDKLPESLDQLAVILQDEDNRKHAFIMKLTEPLLLFLLSIIVGIVVIAMFLPMIKIVNLMSGWVQ